MIPAVCTDVSVVLDHGVLTCWMQVEGVEGSWGQGFGGYDLRGDAGARYLQRLMTTFDVCDLADLKGKQVRVVREPMWGHIIKVGHPSEDRWFYPERDIYNAA